MSTTLLLRVGGLKAKGFGVWFCGSLRLCKPFKHLGLRGFGVWGSFNGGLGEFRLWGLGCSFQKVERLRAEGLGFEGSTV